jgi:hypothetical protein
MVSQEWVLMTIRYCNPEQSVQKRKYWNILLWQLELAPPATPPNEVAAEQIRNINTHNYETIISINSQHSEITNSN